MKNQSAGFDVSAPPTGEVVTGEDDAQHGEVVDTHTESSSVASVKFSPHQQVFSSAAVDVPPLSLPALPPTPTPTND